MPITGYTVDVSQGNIILYEDGNIFRDTSQIIKIGNEYHVYSSHHGDYTDVGLEGDVGVTHFSAPNPAGPWTKQSVIFVGKREVGNWAEFWVYAPEVVYDDGIVYLYVCSSDVSSGTAFRRVGLLKSTNPYGPFVEMIGNPVLEPSFNLTDWDGQVTISACPLKMPDGSWRLYHKGAGYPNGIGTRLVRTVGYRTCTAEGFKAEPQQWSSRMLQPMFGQGINGSPDYDNIDDAVPVYLHGKFYLILSRLVSGQGIVENLEWFSSPNGFDQWEPATNMPWIVYEDFQNTALSGYAVGHTTCIVRGVLQGMCSQGNISGNDQTDNMYAMYFPVVPVYEGLDIVLPEEFDDLVKDSDTQSTTIQGTCTANATVTFTANTNVSFSAPTPTGSEEIDGDVTYDRTLLPLNSWRTIVSGLVVDSGTPDAVNNTTGTAGADGLKDGNRITVTCSL